MAQKRITQNKNESFQIPTLDSFKAENSDWTTALQTHNFVGWNTQSTATTKQYADGATVSFANNTTLYAIWEKKQVTPPQPNKTDLDEIKNNIDFDILTINISGTKGSSYTLPTTDIKAKYQNEQLTDVTYAFVDATYIIPDTSDIYTISKEVTITANDNNTQYQGSCTLIIDITLNVTVTDEVEITTIDLTDKKIYFDESTHMNYNIEQNNNLYIARPSNTTIDSLSDLYVYDILHNHGDSLDHDIINYSKINIDGQYYTAYSKLINSTLYKENEHRHINITFTPFNINGTSSEVIFTLSGTGIPNSDNIAFTGVTSVTYYAYTMISSLGELTFLSDEYTVPCINPNKLCVDSNNNISVYGGSYVYVQSLMRDQLKGQLKYTNYKGGLTGDYSGWGDFNYLHPYFYDITDEQCLTALTSIEFDKKYKVLMTDAELHPLTEDLSGRWCTLFVDKYNPVYITIADNFSDKTDLEDIKNEITFDPLTVNLTGNAGGRYHIPTTNISAKYQNEYLTNVTYTFVDNEYRIPNTSGSYSITKQVVIEPTENNDRLTRSCTKDINITVNVQITETQIVEDPYIVIQNHSSTKGSRQVLLSACTHLLSSADCINWTQCASDRTEHTRKHIEIKPNAKFYLKSANNNPLTSQSILFLHSLLSGDIHISGNIQSLCTTDKSSWTKKLTGRPNHINQYVTFSNAAAITKVFGLFDGIEEFEGTPLLCSFVDSSVTELDLPDLTSVSDYSLSNAFGHRKQITFNMPKIPYPEIQSKISTKKLVSHLTTSPYDNQKWIFNCMNGAVLSVAQIHSSKYEFQIQDTNNTGRIVRSNLTDFGTNKKEYLLFVSKAPSSTIEIECTQQKTVKPLSALTYWLSEDLSCSLSDGQKITLSNDNSVVGIYGKCWSDVDKNHIHFKLSGAFELSGSIRGLSGSTTSKCVGGLYQMFRDNPSLTKVHTCVFSGMTSIEKCGMIEAFDNTSISDLYFTQITGATRLSARSLVNAVPDNCMFVLPSLSDTQYQKLSTQISNANYAFFGHGAYNPTLCSTYIPREGFTVGMSNAKEEEGGPACQDNLHATFSNGVWTFSEYS